MPATTNSEGAGKWREEFAEYFQDKDVVMRVLTEPADRVTMGNMKPTLNELEFMQTYLTERIQAMSGKNDLLPFVHKQFAEEAGAQ